MKKNGKHSYRLNDWGVVVAHDSGRPSKKSKRLKPKNMRPARKGK